MKVLYYYVFVLLIVFSGCRKNEGLNFNDSDSKTRIELEGRSFDATQNVDRSNLIKEIIDDYEIVILHSDLKRISPFKGESFLAITAKYNENENIISIMLPLSKLEQSKTGGGSSGSYGIDCTMKCNAADHCNECSQVVHEKCKSQTCVCNQGWGGCSSEVIFEE